MNTPAAPLPALELDGALLLDQLRRLGEIGADPEAGGRTRIALTDDERAGRDLVVEWMRALDLDVQVDRIGNVFGTLRSAPSRLYSMRALPTKSRRRRSGWGSRIAG